MWFTKYDKPSYDETPTTLISTEQEARFYRQTYKRTKTTTWYYDYQRYENFGDHQQPRGQMYYFQESLTYQWSDFLSAEEIANQNQEDIAKYGIPPYASIVSRQVSMPQQYNMYVQKQIEQHFKSIQPAGPKPPKAGSGRGKGALSFGLDFVPFLGTAKAFQQAFTGKDLVTGKTLSTGERWAEGIGGVMSFIPFPGMKHVGKYGVEGLISLSDEAWDAGKQLIEHSDDIKPLLKEPAAGDNIGIMLRHKDTGNAKLSPSNYPNPDPPMSVPPVRYEPKTIKKVIRMRQGKGPTTKMTHGDKNIEAHHRQQVPVKNGGILDELEQRTHRGGGNHTTNNSYAAGEYVDYGNIDLDFIKETKMGELAWFLEFNQYTRNEDLFAFNWEANGHVVFAASAFSQYLQGISSYLDNKAEIDNTIGDTPHFTLVGHSAGGLVSRYFIENLMDGNGPVIDKLITVATPHWGSNEAYGLGNGGLCGIVTQDLDRDDSYLYNKEDENQSDMCFKPGDNFSLNTKGVKYYSLAGIQTDGFYKDGSYIISIPNQHASSSLELFNYFREQFNKITGKTFPMLVNDENGIEDSSGTNEPGYLFFGDRAVAGGSGLGIPSDKQKDKEARIHSLDIEKRYLMFGKTDHVMHTNINHYDKTFEWIFDRIQD